MPEALAEALSRLTDWALVRPADLVYEPSTRSVLVPIVRFPSKPRRLLGGHTVDRSTPIRAELLLRNVELCKIENHAPELEVIQVVFGAKFGGNSVYLGSVEEDRGVTCYSVAVQVSAFDIELTDLQ